MLLRDGSNHAKPIEYPKESYSMLKEVITNLADNSSGKIYNRLLLEIRNRIDALERNSSLQD